MARSSTGCDLTIGLAEAFSGAEVPLRLSRAVRCADCGGDGLAPVSRELCPDCGGEGWLRTCPDGIRIRFACPRCGGYGVLIGRPCPRCRGEGRVEQVETVVVRVPPGADDGMTLCVGDANVVVRVRPDPRFRRQGDDLLCESRVSFPVAALGGTIRVRALDRTLRVRVPAGTQPGQTLRVRGAGMPRRDGRGRGDLLVRLSVDVPDRLDERQRRVLKDLAGELGLPETGGD